MITIFIFDNNIDCWLLFFKYIDEKWSKMVFIYLCLFYYFSGKFLFSPWGRPPPSFPSFSWPWLDSQKVRNLFFQMGLKHGKGQVLYYNKASCNKLGFNKQINQKLLLSFPYEVGFLLATRNFLAMYNRCSLDW